VNASEKITAIAVSGTTTSSSASAVYLIVPPAVAAPSPNTSASFFGMDINFLLATPSATPWPDIPFGTLRLWDTSTLWSDLNPSAGTYTWGNLDRQISLAQANGAQIILTFGGTPPWAISTGIQITSIARTNGIVTVTTATPHGLYFNPIQQPANQANFAVSGVTDASYDGYLRGDRT